MIEIIKESERKSQVSYSLEFRNRKRRDCGHSFPCDENGTVDITTFAHVAIINYIRCSLGQEIKLGIRKNIIRWTEPALGKCYCGKEVNLGEFTNECEYCGRLYNWCGHELAPREEWEDEMYDEYRDEYIENY